MYNGNIAAMSVGIPAVGDPLLYLYTYDQLNRLKAMNTVKKYNLAVSNNWTNPSYPNDFKENITYDANGNILTYLRNGNTTDSKPLAMDNLSYQYKPGTNQREYIDNGVSNSNYAVDIDDQSAGNYTYDAIGNMIKKQSI